MQNFNEKRENTFLVAFSMLSAHVQSERAFSTWKVHIDSSHCQSRDLQRYTKGSQVESSLYWHHLSNNVFSFSLNGFASNFNILTVLCRKNSLCCILRDVSVQNPPNLHIRLFSVEHIASHFFLFQKFYHKASGECLAATEVDGKVMGVLDICSSDERQEWLYKWWGLRHLR